MHTFCINDYFACLGCVHIAIKNDFLDEISLIKNPHHVCAFHSLYVCLSSLVAQCELYHWVDVLDRFDKILSEACRDGEASLANSDPTQCVFMCPRLQDDQVGLFVSPLLPSYIPTATTAHSLLQSVNVALGSYY